MPNGLFIRLPESLKLPSDEVGDSVRLQARWQQQGIPVLPTLVVPRSTLKLLAQSAKLANLLEKLLKNHRIKDNSATQRLKNQVINTFRKIPISKSFASEFLTEYNHYLGGNFVQISTPEVRTPNAKQENVKGDASVFESFLEVWAENTFYLSRFAPERTSIEQLLLDQPIIIQKTSQTTASGIGYTLNPSNLEKTTLVIYACWGVFETSQYQALDCYQFDIRTNQTKHQTIAPKLQMLKRAPDKLISSSVPTQQQMSACLEPNQIKQLSELILKVKKLSIDHLEVSWVLDQNGFFITGTKPVDSQAIPHNIKQKSETPTTTKIMVSTGNPLKAGDHLSQQVDGIGIFRSEYIVAKTGLHPKYILKTKYKKLLEHDFNEAIATYQSKLMGKPFLFRSLNLTSSELLRLKFAEQYENREDSAYLGYRGGMRLLNDPDWFDFELKIINSALRSYRSTIGLVLPFVRSASELAQLQNKLNYSQITNFGHFELWLQVNTPENILNIQNYPLSQLSGVSINIKSLQGLMTGSDPDSAELSGLYPPPNQLLENILQNFALQVRQIQPNMKILLHLETYQSGLVELAVKNNFTGITIKPAMVERAHEDIKDLEKSLSRFE